MEKREAKFADGSKFFTRTPTLVEVQEADWEFSRVFNKAITSGILPRAALLKRLVDSGVWSEEKDNITQKLRTELNSLISRITEMRDNKEDEKELDGVVRSAESVRMALAMHLQELESLMAHTAEQKADDARTYHLVYLVTERENGVRVWKTFAEFMGNSASEDFYEAVLQFMMLQNGIPQTKEVEKDAEAKQ